MSIGSADGLKVGDELASWVPPRRLEPEWPTLPAQDLARLLVTRVSEHSATVRVTRLKYPVLREGLPVRLIARMP